MLKFHHIFFLGLLCFLFTAFEACAFVVQKKETALSFNNISRAVASPTIANAPSRPQKKEGGDEDKDSGKEKSEDVYLQLNHEPINYLEIADKLIPEDEPKKLYVDMRKKIAQTISAKPGQTFFIVLPETQDNFWKTDESLKLAEVVSSEHSGNKRILEFRTLCCGEAKFFIDNLAREKNTVLQSKIIRLRVQKK